MDRVRSTAPLNNQPAKQPQTFDRRISQTTWSIETKFWGDDEHPKERICPKNYGLKFPTTPGIAKPCQEHYELGFIRKSTNQRPNPVFEESRSSTKSHKALTHDPLNEIRREIWGSTRTLEESRQTFYTHHERFIQGIACLLNIHPSLKISPWSSQASPMKHLGKIGSENSKGKWARVLRDCCHPLSIYMETAERRNYAYYIKLGYTPLWGTLGILVVAPSDRCPATAPRLASTQALQSRRMSSASKLLGAPGSRLRPPSLRSWFCGSTK
jgi:hypothetical protein